MSENLSQRKQRHLDICLDRSFSVESGTTGLEFLGLPHRSLPECNASQVDLQTDFLGYSQNLPVMISCMTGGSEEGRRLNRLLAKAAQETRLAIGTGSIRVMLRHPETQSHFDLKSLAPDVPVLANIGAAQLLEYSPKDITEAVKTIQADALYVHLNPAQELFQEGGDPIFKGWYEGLDRLINNIHCPVLVKETGAGIPPVEGLKLLKLGAAYVDIAGLGGTDWIAVEGLRQDGAPRAAADSFRAWGYPTATLLLAYRQIRRAGGESGRLIDDRIIASGGLRTPRDFAASLAAGAFLGAGALPFIQRAWEGGPDAVLEYIESLEIGLRAAVTLTGTGNLPAFRNIDLRIPKHLSDEAQALAEEALKVCEGTS